MTELADQVAKRQRLSFFICLVSQVFNSVYANPLWSSTSPFVGLFLAHISRGRTIRQFIAGTLTFPTIYCFVWISIFGGTALEMERKAAEYGRWAPVCLCLR